MRSRNVSSVMFSVVGTVTCSALRLVQQRDGVLCSDRRCAVSPHLEDAIIVDGSLKSKVMFFGKYRLLKKESNFISIAKYNANTLSNNPILFI